MKKLLLTLVCSLVLLAGFTSCDLGSKEFNFYLANDTTVAVADWAVYDWNEFKAGNNVYYHNDENKDYYVATNSVSNPPISVPKDTDVIPVFVFKGIEGVYTSIDSEGVYHYVTMDTPVKYYIWTNKFYEAEERSAAGNVEAKEYDIVKIGEVSEDGTWIFY